ADRRGPGSTRQSDRENGRAHDQDRGTGSTRAPDRDAGLARARHRDIGLVRAPDRDTVPVQAPGSDAGSAVAVGRHWSRPACDDRERGSATVLGVGVLAATVILAAGFAAMGQAGAARHQAQGAADAAALAAAAKVLLGPGEACSAAAELVAENRAEMESCEV